MTVLSLGDAEPLDHRRPTVPRVAAQGLSQRDEFVGFYRAAYAKVAGQLYAYLGNAAETEDVVQEAFLRAWQRWDRVSGFADPQTWVRRVAVNLAHSRWRRLVVAARASRHHGDPPVVPGIGPDHVALVAALRTLPDRQRLAVVLHYLADRSVADIALELGASRNTVLSWLHRARAKLAEQLTDRPLGAPRQKDGV